MRLGQQIALGPAAFWRRTRPGSQPAINCIFDAARAGDGHARMLGRARYMGIGLANLVNTLSPELIVLAASPRQDILFPL